LCGDNQENNQKPLVLTLEKALCHIGFFEVIRQSRKQSKLRISRFKRFEMFHNTFMPPSRINRFHHSGIKRVAQKCN